VLRRIGLRCWNQQRYFFIKKGLIVRTFGNTNVSGNFQPSRCLQVQLLLIHLGTKRNFAPNRNDTNLEKEFIKSKKSELMNGYITVACISTESNSSSTYII
jgi:hypothetical protein